MSSNMPEETCWTSDERTPLPLRELAFPPNELKPPVTFAVESVPLTANTVPQAQAQTDLGTFATVALFQVRRIRNPVALEFALAQAWSLLDARQFPLPAVPPNVTSFIPCKLLITMRHYLSTDERIGRLQFVRDDGTFFHEGTWVIRIPRPPAP